MASRDDLAHHLGQMARLSFSGSTEFIELLAANAVTGAHEWMGPYPCDSAPDLLSGARSLRPRAG